MDLFGFYASVRRLAWLIVACCLVGATAGAFLELRNPSGYVAQVQLFATNPRADNVSVSQSQSLALMRMDSYVRLASTEAVARELANSGASQRAPRDIAEGIDASVTKGTVLMTVRIKAPTRQEARALSEAMPVALSAAIASLSPSPDNGGGAPDLTTLTIVNGPNVTATRVLPRLLQAMALGLLVGLTLGAVIAAIHTRFRRGIRSPIALRDLTDLPVVGVVPTDNAFDLRKRGDLGTRRHRWNSYRRLSRNIRVVLPNVEPPIVAVTSARSGAGASATAAGLAAALASQDRPVLLLDTMVDEWPSLGEASEVESAYSGTVHQVHARPGLRVARLTPPNEQGLANALRTNEFSYIIIDLPPMLTDSEALQLVDHADVVLLVARQYATMAGDMSSAAQSLFAMGARNVATVLNRVEPDSIPESQLLAGVALVEHTPRPVETTREPG